MPKVEILKQKGYHFLWINDELWMWDIPEEVEAYREIASQAKGEVLVAGYGLGIIQKALCSNTNINSLLTIEKFPEVIEKCRRIFGQIYGNHRIGDFYDFSPNEKFDCVIGDIWLDSQTPKYLDDYVRFKERAQTLLNKNGRVLAWGLEYFEYLLSQKP